MKRVYLLLAFALICISSFVSATSGSSNFLNLGDSVTLSPIGAGISSASVETYNTTWLNFTNANGRVQIQDNINYSQAFSLSFWFNKPNNAISPAERYMGKLATTNNQRTFEIHSNSGDDVWFVVYHNGSSTNTTTSQINGLIQANTWYHVVAKWDGNATYLFLNGRQIDRDSSLGGNQVFNSDTNLTFGNNQVNSGFYNGSLDEIRVYNQSLSNVQVADLYLKGRNGIINGSFPVLFYDNFSSYLVGNNTTPPNWIPQYTNRVNITEDHRLLIDSFIEQGGDKDIHATLNVTEIPSETDSITIETEYNISSSNCTGTGTVGSMGLYLHYNTSAFVGTNSSFISGEWKVNGTVGGSCGNGPATLSSFKRVNGTSYTLCTGTCPTFQFEHNKTYKAKLSIQKINGTSYNVSYSLNDIILVSSINVTIGEIFPGQTLIESVYSKTYFNWVNVTRTGQINNSILYYRLNEYESNITYNQYGISNGSIVGNQTYYNDGILVNATGYALNTATGLLTLPSELLYDWIETSWEYVGETYVCTSGDRSTLNLILIVGVLMVLLPFLFIYAQAGGDWTEMIDLINLKFLIVTFIIIAVGLAFLITSAQNIDMVCAA